MPCAKVTFMDDATGQEREKTVELPWFQSDRDQIRRIALNIVRTWRGISNPRVTATMTKGDTGWVPEEGDESDV